MASTEMQQFYTLIAGQNVFLMQAGFAMLEVGAITSRSAKEVFVKNLLDFSITALAFWVLGYGIGFGTDTSKSTSNAFIGVSQYFTGEDNQFGNFFLQVGYAATTATIISGAIAERTHILAYVVNTVVLTAIVYPLVAFWVWSEEGWLYDLGFIDFAGSSVIHLMGGVFAFIGAKIVGPRLNAAAGEGRVKETSHNPILSGFGGLLLWYSWYSFNSAPAVFLAKAGEVAARTHMNTTFGAVAGMVTALVINRMKYRFYSISSSINGCLIGLVAITAPCHVVDTSIAILIGAIAGALYHVGKWIGAKTDVDDPLDAFIVHGVGGAWGTLSVGFFAVRDFVRDTRTFRTGQFGLFYGGGIKQLGVQLLGTIVVFAWSAAFAFLIFYGLKRANRLRIRAADEMEGVDNTKYGGSAYPEFELRRV